MVTIDNNKNIQRIVDVIKADTNLYDSGATPGKLRDVFFGDPENNNKQSSPQLPYLYVTTRKSLQKTRRDIGITLAENAGQIVVEYELTIVAKSDAKAIEAQKQIYAIVKNLTALTQTDPTFKDPTSGIDAIFSRSVISEINNDESTRGKLVTSITVVLLATIGSTFLINFPAIGDVLFLSRPSFPEGIVFDDDNIQDGTRTITPNGDFGSFFGEYESTFALDAAFRAKLGIEENITYKKGTQTRIINVVYVDVNPTVSFDNIERSIIHLEIVK